MRLIDYAPTGVNILEHILQVIFEYDMIFKVFPIILDNAFAKASTNASAMTDLRSYVFGSANTSGLLHQLCACHIINLIVNLSIFIKLFSTLILLTRALQLSHIFALHTSSSS
jgi:hypothetical protein